MTTTLDNALRYIALGWHVMPVYSAPGGVCRCHAGPTCKNPGKHPDAEHGQHNATVDAATVKRWFKSNGRNIGVACASSGFITLDVDGPRTKNGNTDGRADLTRLIEELGPLPDTVTADTGSGALHLLYKDPGVETVGKIGKAIDVQRNKLIVVAPSVHASGGVYSGRAGRAPWEIPLAELPPEWIERLRASEPEEREERPASRGQAIGEDIYTALESLDQRYVLQCVSGTWLTNGERFAFKASRKGKRNLIVDRGDGWEGTSNFIDSSGRIAARSTGSGSDDGGPLASTWLRYYGHDDRRGDFYSWIPEFGCYRKCTDDQIVSAIQRKLRLGDPTAARDVRAALIPVDDVLIEDVELGEWIGKPTVSAPALELAPVCNGLLHLKIGKLHDATPRLFHTAALGVNYDREAPEPAEWLKFLNQLWPDDQDSITALQDWIGYLLTPDTSFHKIMLIVGPKRSGKGTIARVINALLGGKDSVTAPTLASLGTNFGLAPLIGKIAAIVGDARLGGRTDVPQVVERLLNLSGEDAQSVDRKHRDAWHGQLMARFTIISNEPPRFTDASDALPARMVALELVNSFYGKEDRLLTDKLIGGRGHRGELPGILRWAVEGWGRLQDRGHFVQPASSAHLIEDLEDLASPVKAWVRERCEQGGALRADCKAAFADFQRWCAGDAHQKHVVTATRFGIDLRTAAQVKRVQKAGGHDYHGIQLRPEPAHWIKPVPPPGDHDRPYRRDVDG